MAPPQGCAPSLVVPSQNRSRRRIHALFALLATLLVAGAAAPAAAAQEPSSTSLPAGTDASERISEARSRVDQAVAEHRAAVADEAAAKRAVTELTGELEAVEARIAQLSPKHAAEVEAYSDTRSRLVDAAVATYISGGQRAVQISLLADSSDVTEYAAKMSFAGIVSDQLNARADRHARAAAELRGSLRELGETRSDLEGRLSNARDELDRAKVRVAETATEVTSARDELTRLVVAAADSAAAEAGGNSVADIGPVALDAYVRAAERVATETPQCRLPWWAIAAIGRVESGHGTAYGSTLGVDGVARPPILGPRLDGGRFAAIRDTDGGRLDGDLEWDRAVGPMQFIPSTWAAYTGDGVSDPQNIYDAALAAGRYLCRGARGVPLDTLAGLRAGAYSYNRSTAYVDNVVAGARRYAAERVGPAGPRMIFGSLADGPAWDQFRAAARVDLNPWRPTTATVDTLLAGAGLLPQRSTIVLVTGPGEGAGVLVPAVRRSVEGLMGRRLVVVVTADDAAVASAVEAAVAGWPNASVVHAAGASAAWSEHPGPGLDALVVAVGSALTS